MINRSSSPKRTVGQIIGMPKKDDTNGSAKRKTLSPNTPVWRHIFDIAKGRAKAWLNKAPLAEPDTGKPMLEIARGLYVHENDVYLVLGTCRNHNALSPRGSVVPEGERMPMVLYVSLSTGRLFVRNANEFCTIVTWPQGIEAALFVHRRLFSNDPLVLSTPIKFSVKHAIDVKTNPYSTYHSESTMAEACIAAFGGKGFHGYSTRKFMFGQVMVTVEVVCHQDGRFAIELRNVPFEMMALYDRAMKELDAASARIAEDQARKRQMAEEAKKRYEAKSKCSSDGPSDPAERAKAVGDK